MMNDKTRLILTGVIGILIGAGISMAAIHYHMGREDHEMSDGRMVNSGKNMEGEMGGMMTGLNGKSGDAFDKAFLSEMVTHHQGAVQMAQAALQNANHQEIKDLAQKIITAQNAEITQMQDWQKTWYGQ